jgi:hypothetical protein
VSARVFRLLIRFEAREFDNLAPLLGFIDDQSFQNLRANPRARLNRSWPEPTRSFFTSESKSHATRLRRDPRWMHGGRGALSGRCPHRPGSESRYPYFYNLPPHVADRWRKNTVFKPKFFTPTIVHLVPFTVDIVPLRPFLVRRPIRTRQQIAPTALRNRRQPARRHRSHRQASPELASGTFASAG